MKTFTRVHSLPAWLIICIGVLARMCYLSPVDYSIHRLALWIDGKEIERFLGYPYDIFVIQDGVVLQYIRDAYLDSQLPILPQEVKIVEITWAAEDEYKYYFSDLKSLDPDVIYNPLLSIPQSGLVPKQKSVFEISIPCTYSVTGVGSMYIVLHIHDKWGQPVPGSPLKLHLRKRCIAFQNKRMCKHECKNGGKCNTQGQCECKPGYLGENCQLASCFPQCENDGICFRPGECKCRPNFTGTHCETAICSEECQHGGTCVLPDQCECKPGYYGSFCHIKTGVCAIPCTNGGTCSANNHCLCPDGYSGNFCQNPICKKSCGVNGRCIAPNQCACYRGWRGRFCHKTVNNPKRRKRRKNKFIKHGHLDYDASFADSDNCRGGKKGGCEVDNDVHDVDSEDYDNEEKETGYA